MTTTTPFASSMMASTSVAAPVGTTRQPIKTMQRKPKTKQQQQKDSVHNKAGEKPKGKALAKKKRSSIVSKQQRRRQRVKTNQRINHLAATLGAQLALDEQDVSMKGSGNRRRHHRHRKPQKATQSQRQQQQHNTFEDSATTRPLTFAPATFTPSATTLVFDPPRFTFSTTKA